MTAEKKRRSFTALRSRSAQLRLRAMRAQLTAGSKYCSTAEHAFIFGRVQLGINAAQNAKHVAQKVRLHLEEPNHVPANAVAGIRDELAELEREISNLEARFQSQVLTYRHITL